jgi:hypothetical protein
MTADGFVEHLRTRLTEVAANVDRTRPENRELIINERGEPSLNPIAHLNRRHFTAEKLEAAIRDIVNRFHRFTLPRYWGDEKRVAADGTQYELAERTCWWSGTFAMAATEALPTIM